MSISESCSCGASFTADRDDELKLLNQWRIAHRCKDTGDLIFNNPSTAVIEKVDSNLAPELQLGFRYDEEDSVKR
jgi:hypothetical protein